MSLKSYLRNVVLIACVLVLIVCNNFLKVTTPPKKKQDNVEPTVKILVGYHKKPRNILKDEDIFVPIHLGRDVSLNKKFHGTAGNNTTLSLSDYNWFLKNMIGDNTPPEDNISKFNRNYCDLTGMYWALKNFDKLNNPDYIGFFHYRRHFAFKKINELLRKTEFKKNNDDIFISKREIDEAYKAEFGLNKKTIIDTIKNYDIILPYPKKLSTTVLKDYEKIHKSSKNLDLAFKIIENEFPEYKECSEFFKNSSTVYFRNIFIMKREIFEKIANINFYVLEKIRKKIVSEEYDDFHQSFCAFINERILNIFILNEKLKEKSKILELNLCHLESL